MSDSQCTKLTFGSWALRGKCHVIRLVMEYLKIPHQSIVYKTPQSWYEDPLSKSNSDLSLPYLVDSDFMVSEPTSILIYILKKYGHQNFLGVSIEDQANVDMYLSAMDHVFKKIIGAPLKPTDSVEELVKLKEEIWKRGIEPKLRNIQNFLIADNWFLGYLSVVDFDIYEAINYIRILYPSKLSSFEKMDQISKRIASLPQIRLYNGSEDCRNLCFLPVQMCKRYKTQ